mmetsp:Transcript_143492/g.458818  ORF Transcript_143492/g.458818 Transcript_143492/m.458818 type:complete len:234 (-) Transcript_143492:607-1308(-)
MSDTPWARLGNKSASRAAPATTHAIGNISDQIFLVSIGGWAQANPESESRHAEPVAGAIDGKLQRQTVSEASSQRPSAQLHNDDQPHADAVDALAQFKARNSSTVSNWSPVLQPSWDHVTSTFAEAPASSHESGEGNMSRPFDPPATKGPFLEKSCTASEGTTLYTLPSQAYPESGHAEPVAGSNPGRLHRQIRGCRSLQRPAAQRHIDERPHTDAVAAVLQFTVRWLWVESE